MLLRSPSTSRAEFEAGTGWQLKSEGACQGDVCIPLSEPAGEWVDIARVAKDLGMPIVAEPEYGLWALGPASVGLRALASAQAPNLRLPDLDGHEFQLSSLRGQKVLLYAWAPYCGCSRDLPVWQSMRNELHPKGIELVTVGLDALGGAGCRALIEAAKPEHPSLIDRHHVLAELFGVINIPSCVWIDEAGMIVRPAETAPAPPQPDNSPSRFKLPSDTRDGFAEMAQEAAKIKRNAPAYHAALRDWVEHGAASRFALSPDEVVERSRPRDKSKALGHAHFQLATQLEADGHHEVAVRHFRDAHRLVPDSWTFRRQAWSLERVGEGPLARFWQGQNPAALEASPYEGDWLSDVRKVGAENYNEPWRP